MDLLGIRRWGLDAGNLPAIPDIADDVATGEHDDPARILLVYNNPEDPVRDLGVGWTLLTGRDWTWYPSVALAAHGAGALTSTLIAQAAAVRVLGARGVRVTDWPEDAPGRRRDGVTAFRGLCDGVAADTPVVQS